MGGGYSFHQLWKIAVTICLLLTNSDAFGQTTPFITTLNLTDANLTAGQLTIKQSYQQSSFTTGVQLISLVNPLQIQQPGGIVSLQVPGDTTTYTFTAVNIEGYYSGDFFWYGELTGTSHCPETDLSDDCFSGVLSIVGKNNQMFGEMRIDTSFYLIPSLGGGLNALVKTQEGNKPVCISEGPSFIPTSPSEEREPCPVVKVLVLYTQRAKDSFPDVENIAAQAFANTKQTILNSDISKTTLDIQLAGIVLLSGFTESGNWETDETSILTANSTARQLRSAYQADLVIIMTDDVYSQFRGKVFAFGDSIPDRDSAFAFVEVPHALGPTYTFTHEFGHLFGMRHQNQDNCGSNWDNSGLPHAHAYAFHKGCGCLFVFPRRYYKTVVSPCEDNSERITILHYSNPDVEYKKQATGTSSTNNNAKVMKDAACRVSDYVQSNDVNVHFVRPEKVCPGDIFTLFGGVTGDYGPYTYQWRYKIGYNGQWSNIITPSPQDELQLTAPTGFYGVIYVELTGTNGTDQATYASGIVVDYFCDNPRPTSSSQPSELTGNAAISAFPTPTAHQIHVLLKEPVGDAINVLITNLLGKTHISTIVSPGETPFNQFDINLPDLPNGQYILTVRSAHGLPLSVQFTVFK